MAVRWWRAGPTGRVGLQMADITEWSGDVVVNSAKETLMGGGGVDGALHAAAGPELLEECRAIPEERPGVRCPTGEVRLTGGHNLSSAHVIHTVGPVYAAHSPERARDLLYRCYSNALTLATEKGFKTIAFPAVSCGAFGFPLGEAARVAVSAALERIGDPVEEVHFVLFDEKTFKAFSEAACLILGDEIPDYSTYVA